MRQQVVEDKVDKLTDRLREITEELEMWSTLKDTLDVVSDTVEDLSISLAKCRREICDQATIMREFETRLSLLNDLVHSVSLLTWSLDQQHTKTKRFVDLIGPDTSPKRLGNARDALRDSLPLRHFENRALKLKI